MKENLRTWVWPSLAMRPGPQSFHQLLCSPVLISSAFYSDIHWRSSAVSLSLPLSKSAWCSSGPSAKSSSYAWFRPCVLYAIQARTALLTNVVMSLVLASVWPSEWKVLHSSDLVAPSSYCANAGSLGKIACIFTANIWINKKWHLQPIWCDIFLSDTGFATRKWEILFIWNWFDC